MSRLITPLACRGFEPPTNWPEDLAAARCAGTSTGLAEGGTAYLLISADAALQGRVARRPVTQHERKQTTCVQNIAQ